MSSDERFPYSRRAIVGAGSIGLVAAAGPARPYGERVMRGVFSTAA